MLNRNELNLIASFLEELSERFSNDGCNDFEIKDTEENRVLLRKIMEPNDEFHIYSYSSHDVLLTNNFQVVSALQERIFEELS